MEVGHDVEIRLLGREDSAMLRELLGVFGAAFGEEATYTEHQPRDEYLRQLLGGDSFIAVAGVLRGEVVAGLAAYELRKFEQERSEVYIYDLAVAEPYRRRGIATALIEVLKDAAKARGAWDIFVQADYGDDAAVSLYSKVGVREDVMHFDIALA